MTGHPAVALSYSAMAYFYEGDVYCAKCLPENIEGSISTIFADAEWDEYPVCTECGEVHDYVSLTQGEAKPEREPDKHGKVLICTISGSDWGVVYEKQVLFFLWDGEKYVLDESFWHGWHENLVTPYETTLEEAVKIIEDNDRMRDPYHYDLDDPELRDNVPESFYKGLCIISQRNESLVLPFTWECFECEAEQHDEPAWWGMIHGDGGIGIVCKEPLCEECAPPEDERYF